jgi:hypothetical protein
MIRYAVLALALATVSAAPVPTQSAEQRDQAALEKALAGLTAGPPVHCINQRDVTSTEVHGDKILYELGRSRKWVNETNGVCGGHGDDILVTRSTMSQYCEGDIVTLRDRAGGMTTGSCSLGKFVPYTKAK